MTTRLGDPMPRTDGEAKVRGTAVYGIDYVPAGVLHARLLRSPLPAGRITRLDTSRAEAMPGVWAVCTAADQPALSGWLVKDQPLFAADVVRYEGEPVAAVAADTPGHAAAAVAAIDLEIEPVQPVGDVEAALAPGARLVHPDWAGYEAPEGVVREGNLVAVTTVETGDVQAAFARADLVVEDTFRVQRQHQSYLEPRAAVASYENGRFTIHSASQYPFNVRDRTAGMLGVPSSAVRVVGLTLGGGFGGKLDAYLEPYAAILARKAGRPVRLFNTRAEEFLTGTPRESAVITIRTAVTRDGELLGREMECRQDCGAYAGEGPVLASIPSLVGGTVYRVGAARLRTSMSYTNTAPTGAMRGVGGLYTFFAQERHMDRIAEQLGLDRRELRLRSVYRDGDRLPNGQVLDDVAFVDAFERLEEVAPWAEVSRKDRPWRGVGIAAVNWLTNPMPGTAMLKLNEDGTIGVVTGATEIGSGAVAAGVTQIVAAEFGLDPSRVTVSQPDTDAAGYDAGGQGSRTTRIVGTAVRRAADDLKAQILRVAADHLEADAADLDLADGSVGVVGAPTARVGLDQIATLATFSQGPLTATGSYAAPPEPIDRGCVTGLTMDNMVAVTYHLHLAEVEVDPDTGRVTVLRYVVVQDVGRVVNPQGIRGQIQGGVAQGLGYALWEQLRIDGSRNVERDMEAYRLPLARDVPDVEYVLLEHPDPDSPFGIKGVGEPPAVPVAAAVANAVSDAIGAPITALPITPFDVLAAIRARGDAR